MRGFFTGWGIRILIIAVIAGGALIFRDKLTGNAGDLKVGDCYDSPAGTAEIEDVQHHPCNESHTAEVVFVGKMTGEDNAYPTDTAIDAWVTSNCEAPWTAYTGKNPRTDADFSLYYYAPTSDGWGKGDRGVVCFARRLDGAPMTSSLRAAQ